MKCVFLLLIRKRNSSNFDMFLHPSKQVHVKNRAKYMSKTEPLEERVKYVQSCQHSYKLVVSFCCLYRQLEYRSLFLLSFLILFEQVNVYRNISDYILRAWFICFFPVLIMISCSIQGIVQFHRKKFLQIGWVEDREIISK